MPTPSRLLVGFVALAIVPTCGFADEFERAPIHYSKSTPNNPVSHLQVSLDAGKVALPYHANHGYLPGLLKALNVPESSQMLVFSKTSLQRQRISPKSPRAIYFSDDMYIGYCHDGQVLEISAVDPQLGTVFYTLDQEETKRPRFVRQTDACLLCHGSSQTRQVPGHVLRSVYANRGGDPILSLGSSRVDHTTAMEKRWGGWYVTGTHGKMVHLGNLIVANRNDRETIANNPQGQNVTNLKEFFDTSAYLTPHSDIVALMVLEHQTEMHNLITRANFQTRMALHDQAQLNKELGRSADYQSDTAYRRIKSAGDPLLRYLFFSNETKSTDKIQGTSKFAAEFVKQRPRDARGRSLADLDLHKRLFKYPCSYLIYSDAFAGLPVPMKEYLYQRMHEILMDRDYSRDFDHLTEEDRRAILEILRATKKDWPIFSDQ